MRFKVSIPWKGIGLATILGTAVPTAAFAHEKAGSDRMFKMMDGDGDGKISAAEHAEGARKMFETMDANQDGKVTAEEMTAAHAKITGKKSRHEGMSSADKIKTIDTDGDGVLTAEEHAAGAKTMFDKMDADKDGFLTATELAAGHAKMDKPASKPASK